MPDTPLVSCIMPTYGRPAYIAEAIEMFLAQDYPAKELILLNDCPGQTFRCKLPGVRVVNVPRRYPSLGEKRNAAIEMAAGEIIAVWDDDDVHLPWRLSFSMSEMRRLHTEFYRPAEFWAYWGNAALHHNQAVDYWVSHGLVLFTKDLWKRSGMYPAQGVGEDAVFFAKIHQELQREFIKYPIEQDDRFYVMRGTSLYSHMSISGGTSPLDTSPQDTDIVPTPIQDPILREACNQLVQRHLKSSPRNPEPPDSESLAARPVLSVCVSLKNRSRVVHDGKELMLFPNCIKSLAEAATGIAELGTVEVVVADFSSDDWPLESWIHEASGVMDIQIIKPEGDFSRGRGLNLAARQSRGGTLLFCDADIMVDAAFLRYCIQNTNDSTALFPIIRMLNEDGSEGGLQYFGFGIASIKLDLFKSVGGIPEFKSWGGEDDIFHNRVSSQVTVRRDIQSGLLHQWHPEKFRYEHYIRPPKSDYNDFREKAMVKPCDLNFRSFWGNHPHWHGPVYLYQGGVLSRPGVDGGTYEFSDGEYVRLHWERWPTEELLWDTAKNIFVCPNKAFTLREDTSTDA